MFGALAEEKNVEQQKALTLASRVSKLESKLGLSISQTGLAKKNAALRDSLRRSKDNVNMWQHKHKAQEDDLIRACSEIKVLERALQVKQDDLNSRIEEEEYAGSGIGNNNRKKKKEKGNPTPVRELLLYQLALKKEESHNLALELAHKTKALKANETEIQRLMDTVRNQR